MAAFIRKYDTIEQLKDDFESMVVPGYVDSVTYSSGVLTAIKNGVDVIALTSTYYHCKTVLNTTVVNLDHQGYGSPYKWTLCKFADTILICFGQSSYGLPAYNAILAKDEAGNVALGGWAQDYPSTVFIANINSVITMGVSPYNMPLTDLTNNNYFARLVSVPLLADDTTLIALKGVYGFFGKPTNKIPIVGIGESPYQILLGGMMYYTNGYLAFEYQ